MIPDQKVNLMMLNFNIIQQGILFWIKGYSVITYRTIPYTHMI